ncbi:MAG: dynamin family protein [Acidiferrobacterales bacterium]
MTPRKATDIESHINEYGKWRQRLHDDVEELQEWLKEQDLSDVHVDQSLSEVLNTLRDDKLYVAFVAEFSRGKSELINAIFFAGLGRRILPSAAGRTTMSPTELLYDRDMPPCLRLLPIETRKTGTTIAEYRGFEDEWTVIKLDPKSADSMADALQHIAETKIVSRKEAQDLGFSIASDEHEQGMHTLDDGSIEVPRWRHVIINFPHPLLENGLVILDTPGLNALGAEPELTLNMLPSAHAVLFILAADAGVTKSDIYVWHDHIGAEKSGSSKGRLVVLNKIDGLWDEMRDESELEKEIVRQVKDTAKHLKIPVGNIFPVSAQKGLYGKIKKDKKVLARSRLMELEDALGRELVPAKRDIVRNNIRNDMDEVVNATRTIIKQRLKGVYEHITEVASLNGKNKDVIGHMMDKVRGDKEIFEKSLQRFQATRSIFSQQTNVLYSHLNIKNLGKVIAKTKRDMEISMTTGGLKSCMKKFFAQTRGTMEEVAVQAGEIKSLMEGVYVKFQEEHGLSDIKPSSFSVMRYVREIKRLEKKHEQFMSGISMLMTEQKIVTKQFYDSAVAKVRAIFKMANRDVDNWLKNIMSPMESQVREHQIQLRRRLESIKRIHQASDTLGERVKELEQTRKMVSTQEKDFNKRTKKLLEQLVVEDDKFDTKQHELEDRIG